MPTFHDLFTTKEVILLSKSDHIKLSTARIFKNISYLAIVVASKSSDSDELYILLKESTSSTYSCRNLKWIAGKEIVAIDFSPEGDWLLVATQSGRFCILPVKYAFNKFQPHMEPWNRNDLTYMKIKIDRSIVTCVQWWQTFHRKQIGLAGYKNGMILILDLTHNGKKLGETKVKASVARLDLVYSNDSTMTYCIVTSKAGNQWNLILEERNMTQPRADPEDHIWNSYSVAETSSSRRSIQRPLDYQLPNAFETMKFPFPQSVVLRSHYLGDKFFISSYDSSTGKLQIFDSSNFDTVLYAYNLPRGVIDICLTDSLIAVLHATKTTLSKPLLMEISTLFGSLRGRMMSSLTETAAAGLSAVKVDSAEELPPISPLSSQPNSRIQITLTLYSRQCNESELQSSSTTSSSKRSSTGVDELKPMQLQTITVANMASEFSMNDTLAFYSGYAHVPRLYHAINVCFSELDEPLTPGGSRRMPHAILSKFAASNVFDQWKLDTNYLNLLPDFLMIGGTMSQPCVIQQSVCSEELFLHYLVDAEDQSTAETFGLALRLDMNYLYECAAHCLCRRGLKKGIRLNKIDLRTNMNKHKSLILEYFDLARTPMKRRFKSLGRHWTASECLRYTLQLLRRPDQLSPSDRSYLASSALPLFAKVLMDLKDTIGSEEQQLWNNKFQHFIMNNFQYDEEEAVQTLLQFNLIHEALFVAKERGCVQLVLRRLIDSEWSLGLALENLTQEVKDFYFMENLNNLTSGIDSTSLEMVLRSDIILIAHVMKSIRGIVQHMHKSTLLHWCSLLTPMKSPNPSTASFVLSLFTTLSTDWRLKQTRHRLGSVGSSVDSVEQSIQSTKGPIASDRQWQAVKDQNLSLANADFSKKKALATECFITFALVYLKLIEQNKREDQFLEDHLYFLPSSDELPFAEKIDLERAENYSYVKVMRQFQTDPRLVDINRLVLISCAVPRSTTFSAVSSGASASALDPFLLLGMEPEWNILNQPSQLNLCPIVSVSLGQQHALLLDKYGQVYSAGMNQFGQLGVDPQVDVTTPSWAHSIQSHERRGSHADIQRIQLAHPAVHIAAGAYHSAAIVWIDGAQNEAAAVASQRYRVLTWGWCVFGQLGIRDVTWGEKDYLPQPTDCVQHDWLEDPHDFVVSISLGVNHSLFLTNSGSVYGCGGNHLQQLGFPANEIKVFIPRRLHFLDSRVRLIHTKFYHNICLLDSGAVVTWGEDVYNQNQQMLHAKTAKPATNGNSIPEVIPDDTGAGAASVRVFNNIAELQSGEKFAQLASGSNHNLLLTNRGRVFAVGVNRHGQCGQGHRKDLNSSIHLVRNLPRVHFIAADDNVSLAGESHGQLYFWGVSSHRVIHKVYHGQSKGDFLEPNHLNEPLSVDLLNISRGCSIEENNFRRENLFYFLKECVPYLDPSNILKCMREANDVATIADVFLVLDRLPQSLYWRLVELERDLAQHSASTLLPVLSQIVDYYLNDALKQPKDKTAVLSIIISFYQKHSLGMSHLVHILTPFIDAYVTEMIHILSRPGVSQLFSVSFLVTVLQSWERVMVTSQNQLIDPLHHQSSGCLKDFQAIHVKLDSSNCGSGADGSSNALHLNSSALNDSQNVAEDGRRKSRIPTSLYTSADENKRIVAFACGHRMTFHQLRGVELPTLLDRMKKQNLNLSVQFVQKMFMQDHRLPSCIVCLLKDTANSA